MLGDEQRARRSPEWHSHVDPAAGAQPRRRRDVVGLAFGAEEDDLVGPLERAPANADERPRGRRRGTCAVAHAAPRAQHGRRAHHDAERRIGQGGDIARGAAARLGEGGGGEGKGREAGGRHGTPEPHV